MDLASLYIEKTSTRKTEIRANVSKCLVSEKSGEKDCHEMLVNQVIIV